MLGLFDDDDDDDKEQEQEQDQDQEQDLKDNDSYDELCQYCQEKMRVVFSTLLNIYDRSFLEKQLTNENC